MPWLALVALLAPQALEDLERALREKLAGIESSRPATGGPDLEKWDQALLEAEWEYGLALFRLAEERNQPELHRRVVRHFTELIWRRDGTVAALQARLPLARAHEALGEWGPCLSHLAAARQTGTPDLRKNPDLVEIAGRSLILELRARRVFGRGLGIPLQEAQLHLRQFPGLGETDVLLALRLETARALLALGRPGDAERMLAEIAAHHGEADAGFEALEILAERCPRPEHVERFADAAFDRHHFTAAAIQYRRLARTPRVWLRLGICYSRMRRIYEAIEALDLARAREAPERTDAALRLERVLNHAVTALGDADLRPRLETLRAWIRAHVDLEKAGPASIRAMADGLLAEDRFGEAADLYARLRPCQAGFEQALHSLGFCRFKLGEHAKAVEAFRAYFATGPWPSRDVDAARDLLCRSLLDLGRAEEALSILEKAAACDPSHGEWLRAHRVDALARLGRFKEAEAALAAIRDLRPTLRALERLALGYEEAIRRTGDKRLWGAYARAVVAISEKSLRPLRGEKLLAAADALALEETAEAHAMASDLYAQFLLAPDLPADQRRTVEHRRARSALGSGRLELAEAIALELLRGAPGNGSFRELRGDVAAARAAGLPRGSDRNLRLDEAVRIYGELASDLREARGEHYYRLVEKYARAFFARDPERAREFFAIMEKRGEGAWDEDRWGCRSRMDALRAKVLEAVPPRR